MRRARGGTSSRGGFCSGSAIAGILLLVLLCDLLCFAKPKYDHTAKVTYRAEQKHLKYLLEGRDDLYYDDSYYGDSWICTPGDEHHAPDCRKSQDWYVYEIDRRASVKLALDDGRSMTFVANPEAGASDSGWLHPNCDPEPCESKFPKIANIWHLFDDYYLVGEEKDVEFDVSYRLLKTGEIGRDALGTAGEAPALQSGMRGEGNLLSTPAGKQLEGEAGARSAENSAVS